jgi:hypothetical protein
MQVLWFYIFNPYKFCDPNVGIAFEEEKSNVNFVNFMQVLQFNIENAIIASQNMVTNFFLNKAYETLY